MTLVVRLPPPAALTIGGNMSNSLLRRAALAIGAATLVVGLGTAQVASAAPTPINGWSANVTTHVSIVESSTAQREAASLNA